MNDIVMILVYTFPMFLFTIYPGIWLSDYAEKNYGVDEKIKRTIMVSVTFIGAVFLGALLHYV
jgi:predicted membrane protein